MLINRTNIDKISDLIYEIHDMWFSIEEVVFDEFNHEFKLYFGPEKNLYNQCLRVRGVIACQIEDSEKVGIYDIDYLSVDAKKSRVSIVGCIPIRVNLNVNPDFEIMIDSKGK